MESNWEGKREEKEEGRGGEGKGKQDQNEEEGNWEAEQEQEPKQERLKQWKYIQPIKVKQWKGTASRSGDGGEEVRSRCWISGKEEKKKEEDEGR